MKDKLIVAWNHLNRLRFEVEDYKIYRIWDTMERIQRVLYERYNFSVTYSHPL